MSKLWRSRRLRNQRDFQRGIEQPPEQKASVIFNSGNFLRGAPVITNQTGVSGAYNNSWLAYSCINWMATQLSNVPLLFLSDPDDPESSVPAKHPVRKLFTNPGQHLTTSEFIEWIFIMLNLRGEFFIPFDDPLRPSAMSPLNDPKDWQAIKDGEMLAGWKYQQGINNRQWAYDQLIHHRLLDPSEPYRGLPPLKAAAKNYGIQQGSDSLMGSIIAGGGEKAMIYSAPNDTSPTQIDQGILGLRQRRSMAATRGGDSILPPGLQPLSAEFQVDDSDILESGQIQSDKICAVYGLSKSILGYEDIDKYATFLGRVKMAYSATLIPQATGVEHSFDLQFNERMLSPYRCYVRFDWSKVEALQDDLEQKFKMAGELYSKNLPWAALNERFNLGLNPTLIPAFGSNLVSSTLAPSDVLVDEYSNPVPPPSGTSEPGKVAEGDSDRPRLTNKIIRKRAANPRARLQRNKRLFKIEKDMRKEWKELLVASTNKATKAIAGVTTQDGVKKALDPIFKDLGDKMVAIANPKHEAAALEGEQSIIELVEGKMDDQTLHVFQKAHQWSADVTAFLKKRQSLVEEMGLTLTDDVYEAVRQAVEDGLETQEVQNIIRQRMASAPGGINRATTIARTEVGTAYNTARFSEMKAQDFEKHTWITAGDEEVRDDEFNHVACDAVVREIGKQFPCGLTHPQESGGDAANVINCRCETIPFVKEA
jgi:phage portal protein BeeE